MEQNTVVLSVEKYDELKTYEKLIEESSFICRHQFKSYYSVKESEIIDSLRKQKEYWVNECDKLKKIEDSKTTVKDLEKMSLFTLIKWRLKRNK